jgi:hypothetical protein
VSPAEERDVKYLLAVYAGAQSPAEGDRAFREAVTEAGELISACTLADPERGVVVRVRDGVRTEVEGPHGDARHRLARCYVVDCDSRERVLEVAAMVPEARSTGLEVRPLMTPSGMEM